MLLNATIRVLVVDDSMVFGQFLTSSLPQANKLIQIVGYAANAYEAMEKIPLCSPDVITMDVEMPKMNGIEFLRQVLPRHPIPVIMVSAVNMNVFEALSNGAVDFVRKPNTAGNYGRQEFIDSLASKIVIASRSKVHVAGQTPVKKEFLSPLIPRLSPLNSAVLHSTVIAIGASTGGTEATLQILQELPENMPGIVVTQHMPEGFTQMYAQRLDRLCRLQVKEAANGDRIEPGKVLIAPGSQQMKVVRLGTSYTVSCFNGEKVNGHMPSVDVLFHSMADAVQSNGVGIILTGMGHDGADGLLKMRRAGAYTIGQDKESCVVYGMPMVAHNIGGVCVQSSCANIPRVLMNYLNKK